ncbi:unnamed protein product [Nippostrongylus brasiliensis]|uniref:t-SNARE coiled-coil homology domain-containing protein n=1 Tax=Nippostrongylus brasiliensis TaxID=27835 RepID=A0A0N4Y5W0_NIPBR|nr:unnamed protein product [Nippostrongylus brasiliensis]
MEPTVNYELTLRSTDSEENANVASIADQRGADMFEDEIMAVELEEEFQRFCGREASTEILQVRDQVAVAIKNVEVLMRAEVAKLMRCGHPNREAVGRVGSVACRRRNEGVNHPAEQM